MRMFRRLLLREFLPFLLLGVGFFAMIIVLADIFSNLWRYLNRNIPFWQAIQVSLYYGPKAVSYALPIGGMFAAAFALGTLGARNELIPVFGSGVPLFRFVVPMLFCAAIMSVFGYVFEDRVSIPMLKRRNILSNELLGLEDSKNRSRTSAITNQGHIIYYADYYNDENKSLSGLTVLILGDEGVFIKSIDVEQAFWNDDKALWILKGSRVFTVDEESGDIIQTRHEEYSEELINENPKTFGLDTRKMEEMNSREARDWLETQRRSGIPYRASQAEYFQRFTMALTPFLVILFAGSLGGRFKKNILLMSLLVSLGISSAWYIVRMIFTLMSQTGIIPPIIGAAVPYMIFLIFGLFLFKQART